MKLNIGSGYEPHEGYLNIDVNPNAPGVDVIGPAFPLDFPDGSVDEVRATNILEHLPYRDTERALTEWARVLVADGLLYLIVPDAGEVMRWLVCEPERLIDERLPDGLAPNPMLGAAWRLMGGQADDEQVKDGDDPDWNLHRALFDAKWLSVLLDASGFAIESMVTNIHPNLIVHARKR